MRACFGKRVCLHPPSRPVAALKPRQHVVASARRAGQGQRSAPASSAEGEEARLKAVLEAVYRQATAEESAYGFDFGLEEPQPPVAPPEPVTPEPATPQPEVAPAPAPAPKRSRRRFQQQPQQQQGQQQQQQEPQQAVSGSRNGAVETNGSSGLSGMQETLYPPEMSQKTSEPRTLQWPVPHDQPQLQSQPEQQQHPLQQAQPPTHTQQPQQRSQQQRSQQRHAHQSHLQPQQQQPKPQPGPHQQRRRSRSPTREVQPWWSLPVHQALAASPPAVAVAARQAPGVTPEAGELSPFEDDKASSFIVAGSSQTTLFVKGLNAQAPEKLMRAALVAAFSQAGPVLQVRLPTTLVPDINSGGMARELKGIAFIVFQSVRDKVRAAELLSGACILGRFIHVDADPDSRTRESGGGSSRRERRASMQQEWQQQQQQQQQRWEAELAQQQQQQQQQQVAAGSSPQRRRRGRYLSG